MEEASEGIPFEIRVSWMVEMHVSERAGGTPSVSVPVVFAYMATETVTKAFIYRQHTECSVLSEHAEAISV